MGPALPGGATARSTEGRLTRLRRRLVGEQIWMIGTHHPTIPREARHATLAHGSRHSIRGALWVREGRGWPPCWGGGVACAHTPNIATQPSAHHCLKSTTKTNTNQYISTLGKFDPLKTIKRTKAPKRRNSDWVSPKGLWETFRGDLVGISALGRFKLILAKISCFWGHGTAILRAVPVRCAECVLRAPVARC